MFNQNRLYNPKLLKINKKMINNNKNVGGKLTLIVISQKRKLRGMKKTQFHRTLRKCKLKSQSDTIFNSKDSKLKGQTIMKIVQDMKQ